MPPVSQRQRKAMWAAKSGNSTLGIPQKVGAEFAAADPGGKLPMSAKKKAMGGEVTDQGTHFHVKGEHGEFRIAKNGLHPKTVEKIQGMCSGGAVKMAGGGDSPSPVEGAPGVFSTADGKYVDASGNAMSPVDVAEASSKYAKGVQQTNFPPRTVTEDTGQIDEMTGQPITNQVPNPAVVTPQTTAPGLPSSAQAGGVGQTQMPEMPGYPTPDLIKPTYAGESPLQKQGFQEEKGAYKAQADAAQKEAEALAPVYEAEQQRVANMQTYLQQGHDDITKRAEALKQQVADGTIDPNKYWADGGISRRITSSLGVLLSGLGQGLSAAGGHPTENMAMAVIQKNIERNIDAQKENLAKNRFLYDATIKEYGTLDNYTAAQRALDTAMVAAQAKKVGNQFTGPRAQAAAQLLSAQADAAEGAVRSQFAQQYAKTKTEFDMQQNQLNFQAKLMETEQHVNNLGDNGLLPESSVASPFLKGKGIIRLGNGYIATTADPKDAQEVNKQLAPMNSYQDALVKLKGLEAQLDAGDRASISVYTNGVTRHIPGIGRALTPRAAAVLAQINQSTLGGPKAAEELGRFTDTEEKYFKDLLQNPGIFSSPGNNQVRLSSVIQNLDTKKADLIKTYTGAKYIPRKDFNTTPARGE